MHAIVEPTESIGAPQIDDAHQAVGGDLFNSVAVIVDDDRPRLVEVAIHLVDRGYAVTQSRARSDALRVAIDPTVDAIILDLGQRPTNYLDLIHAVRLYSATPIVVLSERSGPRHRVAALDLGADDYISKPFSLEELLARLRAAVRRAPSSPGRADLVDALALNGRVDEARELFERLLALRNDLGLYAEEYDVTRKRQVGNFP